MRVLILWWVVPMLAICGALSAQDVPPAANSAMPRAWNLAIPLTADVVVPPAGELTLAAPPATSTPATSEPPAPAKSDTAAQPSTTTPAPPPKGKSVIEWMFDQTKVKIGGYIKVDAIHDFNEIGSTDSFDPRTIPTTNSEDPGENTRLHARQTRLNLDLRAPTSAGEVHGFVEGDFFGDGNAFRMRHAYGEIGPILAGQTWTTFMDPDAMPETLDFESPVAFPQTRQTMIRYTHQIKDGTYVAVAIEDPNSTVQTPGVAGAVEEPYPDLNARVRCKCPQGHVQLGLFAGMARFDPDNGNPDDVPLWGANLSTKLTTSGKDNVIGQVTYGDGVGRYRGGITAAPDAQGDLKAIETFGILGSFQHYWSEEYRSSIGYSWAEGHLPNGAAATSTEELGNFFVNFIWQFCERAWTGVEYIWGSRETFDSHTGVANRIQFSIRFDL